MNEHNQPQSPYEPPKSAPVLHTRPENPTAIKLVRISRYLGWGGLLLMFLVGPGIGIAFQSIALVMILIGLGFISAVVGAVIGQIGRAMQGRVI